MEKILSADERIRRAEEIYERRRNQNYKNATATVNVSGNNRDFKLLKKMIIQILICLLIYFIFYLIQTTNYVFSATTLNKTKEILDYDMDVKGIYDEIKSNFINNQEDDVGATSSSPDKNTDNSEQNITEQKNEENGSNNDDVGETSSNPDQNIKEQNNIEENETKQTQQENKEEANLEETNNENKQETNSEIDTKEIITLAQEILNNYSIIKPANGGFISSEFGTREEEGDIVTSYHHGIDIGVITGTDVMASTDGEVILATESSSYGKYIKIQNGDLVTLYAHCNELLVKVGDKVNKGDIVAKSGATGNVTGPHLHFEIIYKGEYINPREVLEF